MGYVYRPLTDARIRFYSNGDTYGSNALIFEQESAIINDTQRVLCMKDK